MTTTPSGAEAHFRAVAPKFMRRLHTAFPQLDEDDLAAIFGNAGHESKGLTDDQEDKPVVKGSRGGANWMQWTGPRRKALEAFAAKKRLDPNGDEAAFQFLVTELRGPEKRAIPAVIAAKTLDAKVKAFEKAFLRAGVKHYPSRLEWAKRALLAYRKESTKPGPAPIPTDAPTAQQVIDIQERLRALGYHEVGAIDGIIGPATENAILIFRKDNGLPLSTRIDASLRDALLRARPRQVADSRANADAKDVRQQAPEAKASWWSKIVAAFGAVGSGIVALFNWLIASFSDAREAVRPITDMLWDVPAWLWALLLAAGFLSVWFMSRRAEQKTVEAYQSGERR
jgi:hypothetical protein